MMSEIAVCYLRLHYEHSARQSASAGMSEPWARDIAVVGILDEVLGDRTTPAATRIPFQKEEGQNVKR